MASYNYCPALPLELDSNKDFISIQEQSENIKQKLKTIILTNPGEKIMEPEFGLGIKKYLFEPVNGALTVYSNADDGSKSYIIDDFRQNILKNLVAQTKRYSPDIIVSNIDITIDEYVMFLTVYYSYRGLFANEMTITISS